MKNVQAQIKTKIDIPKNDVNVGIVIKTREAMKASEIIRGATSKVILLVCWEWNTLKFSKSAYENSG